MLFYNKAIFERVFDHRGKYWYKNIKEIPLYFKLMHHLIKYGYDEYARWETYNWFIDTMKSVLTKYNSNRYGTKIITGNWFDIEENEKAWNDVINRMIELLDLMDGSNPKYDTEEYDTDYEKKDSEMEAAKEEFFQLFSEYFYYLWD